MKRLLKCGLLFILILCGGFFVGCTQEASSTPPNDDLPPEQPVVELSLMDQFENDIDVLSNIVKKTDYKYPKVLAFINSIDVAQTDKSSVDIEYSNYNEYDFDLSFNSKIGEIKNPKELYITGLERGLLFARKYDYVNDNLVENGVEFELDGNYVTLTEDELKISLTLKDVEQTFEEYYILNFQDNTWKSFEYGYKDLENNKIQYLLFDKANHESRLLDNIVYGEKDWLKTSFAHLEESTQKMLVEKFYSASTNIQNQITIFLGSKFNIEIDDISVEKVVDVANQLIEEVTAIQTELSDENYIYPSEEALANSTQVADTDKSMLGVEYSNYNAFNLDDKGDYVDFCTIVLDMTYGIPYMYDGTGRQLDTEYLVGEGVYCSLSVEESKICFKLSYSTVYTILVTINVDTEDNWTSVELKMMEEGIKNYLYIEKATHESRIFDNTIYYEESGPNSTGEMVCNFVHIDEKAQKVLDIQGFSTSSMTEVQTKVYNYISSQFINAELAEVISKLGNVISDLEITYTSKLDNADFVYPTEDAKSNATQPDSDKSSIGIDYLNYTDYDFATLNQIGIYASITMPLEMTMMFLELYQQNNWNLDETYLMEGVTIKMTAEDSQICLNILAPEGLGFIDIVYGISETNIWNYIEMKYVVAGDGQAYFHIERATHESHVFDRFIYGAVAIDNGTEMLMLTDADETLQKTFFTTGAVAEMDETQTIAYNYILSKLEYEISFEDVLSGVNSFKYGMNTLASILYGEYTYPTTDAVTNATSVQPTDLSSIGIEYSNYIDFNFDYLDEQNNINLSQLYMLFALYGEKYANTILTLYDNTGLEVDVTYKDERSGEYFKLTNEREQLSLVMEAIDGSYYGQVTLLKQSNTTTAFELKMYYPETGNNIYLYFEIATDSTRLFDRVIYSVTEDDNILFMDINESVQKMLISNFKADEKDEIQTFIYNYITSIDFENLVIELDKQNAVVINAKD